MLNIKYIWIVSPKNPVKIRNHVHNCYELIYYFSANGQADYYINQKRNANPDSPINYLDEAIDESSKDTINFHDNSLIVFSPKTIHNEIHNQQALVIDVGFEFTNEDISLPVNQLINDKHLEFLPIATRIKEEMIKKDNYYQQFIKSSFESLIIMLSRLSNSETRKVDPIAFAANYVDEYFTTPIDLNDLASQSGYGPEHFRFLFKQRFGIGPKEYILSKRISYACLLLLKTNYSISEIANYSGYDDVCQFSVIFKKKTGLSPLEYRKNNTNND